MSTSDIERMIHNDVDIYDRCSMLVSSFDSRIYNKRIIPLYSYISIKICTHARTEIMEYVF